MRVGDGKYYAMTVYYRTIDSVKWISWFSEPEKAGFAFEGEKQRLKCVRAVLFKSVAGRRNGRFFEGGRGRILN